MKNRRRKSMTQKMWNSIQARTHFLFSKWNSISTRFSTFHTAFVYGLKCWKSFLDLNFFHKKIVLSRAWRPVGRFIMKKVENRCADAAETCPTWWTQKTFNGHRQNTIKCLLLLLERRSEVGNFMRLLFRAFISRCIVWSTFQTNMFLTQTKRFPKCQINIIAI